MPHAPPKQAQNDTTTHPDELNGVDHSKLAKEWFASRTVIRKQTDGTARQHTLHASPAAFPCGSIVTVLDPMSRKRNQVGWATKRHSVTRAQSQHAYLQETFTTSNLRRKLQVIGNINPKGVARLKHACKSVIISLGIAHQYKHLSGLATACGRRSSGALGWSKSE